jgi:hypothetical protein
MNSELQQWNIDEQGDMQEKPPRCLHTKKLLGHIVSILIVNFLTFNFKFLTF